MNKILGFLLVMLLIVPGTVYAGGFNLQSIGGMDVSGKQISHWWYTGHTTTFRGEATPSSPVNITIDGAAQQVAADSSGNWVYTPASFSDGDHSVSLENNGSKIDFTLTIGANNVDMAAVEKGGGAALPASGTFEVTMAIVVAAVVLIGGSYGLLRLW